MLLYPTGAAAFQIVLMGTTKGISREQTVAITERLAELINQHASKCRRRRRYLTLSHDITGKTNRKPKR